MSRNMTLAVLAYCALGAVFLFKFPDQLWLFWPLLIAGGAAVAIWQTYAKPRP